MNGPFGITSVQAAHSNAIIRLLHPTLWLVQTLSSKYVYLSTAEQTAVQPI